MTPSLVQGRYALYEALGKGGAASVYLSVARGDEPKAVAVKRLHRDQARHPGAVTQLLDEVRLSRHMDHPNVVRVIDFVSDGEEMLAVMEYVHGEPLSRLLADARRAGARIPVSIAVAIVCDVLRGLSAAHEATDGDGKPLGLVHRDVTPENVLVGADGAARISDFGVAKAEGRLQTTRDGGVKGKIAYLAPEQIGGEVSPRSDVYAAGLVLWELLVSERPIQGENEAEVLTKALDPKIPPPGTRTSGIPPALDDACMRALCMSPDDRFASAREMCVAVEGAGEVATAAEVSAWVHAMAGERLAAREAALCAMLDAERPAVGPVAPAAGSPRAAGIMLAAGACMIVVAVWIFQDRSSPPPMPAAAPAIVATNAPPLPEPAVVPGPTAVPASSQTSTIDEPVSAEVAPSARAPARPHAQSRPATRKCDPPWLIDSRGIRRYNPDCLK